MSVDLNDFLKSIDTIIMGRKSYDEANKYEDQNPWKGIKNYVFSNTLKETAGIEIIKGDVLKEVSTIKKQKEKDIWLLGVQL